MVNFHGMYAMALEAKVRNAFQFADRQECREHEMDADFIEGGKFVEVMQRLIFDQYGISKELSHFCAETDQYWGVSGLDLSEEQAKKMYVLFESYYC